MSWLGLVPRFLDWVAGHKKGWLAAWSASLLVLCVWTAVVAVETARKQIEAGKAAVIDLPAMVVYCFFGVLGGFAVDSIAAKIKPPAPAAPAPAGGGEADP